MGVREPEQVRDEPRLQAVDLVLVDDPCGGKTERSKRALAGDGSWTGPLVKASAAQVLV